MKIALAAGIAALAFTGAAHAGAFQAGDDIISVTLTGYITGGSDGGIKGANDIAKVFGGGNLYNAAVSLTFSYDATTMAANGSYNYDPSGLGELIDNSDPASYRISVTIGAFSYSVNPTEVEETILCANGYVCGAGNLLVAVGEENSDKYIELQAFNFDAPITEFDVAQQSDINAFLSNPDNTNIIYAVSATGTDSLTASLTQVPGAPEPMTWILLAMGLAGAALMKFRRSAASR